MFNSMSRIFLSRCASGLNVTILSRRLMNSGVNLRRAAVCSTACILAPSFSSTMPFWDCRAHSAGGKAQRGLMRCSFRWRPGYGHEDQRTREIHLAVVAQRERSFVENSQQQIPQCVTGFFDLVKQTKLSLQPSCDIDSETSWLSRGCVSRCPKYPGGEPINLQSRGCAETPRNRS